ncbi:MAG: enoyl-CoA hydratase/isomerase family protein [Parvibaculaceae bacterium]|nr:enoyl-CoA hydratase/isomerase family protein [Parvibaculaceae bacterium]
MSKLHISTPRPNVTLIEIDAPPANALGHSLRAELIDTLDAIENNFDMRALILTGRGKSFCAGDNLREAMERGGETLESLSQFGQLLDKIEQLRIPVIAAINGAAVGGGLELALCCDIRIGTSASKFIAAGVNVGLMASVFRLPRLIGIARAKSMLLSGLPVSGQTALDFGLITALYEGDQLMAEALKLAERIASRAPLSVEASKRQSSRAFDLTPEEAARAALKELSVLSKSKDHQLGVEAFIGRTAPAFTRG